MDLASTNKDSPTENTASRALQDIGIKVLEDSIVKCVSTNINNTEKYTIKN